VTDAIARPASNVPAILEAREAVRAILAPNGADLEALLINLHRQSAHSQRKARRSQAKARAELYKRLEEGQTLAIAGNEVVVATVTTRELIGLVEAESNIVKVEAMAQRSYTVHRFASANASPRGGSIESFITQLEQEEQTEGFDAREKLTTYAWQK
jgi:hypothetical protein